MKPLEITSKQFSQDLLVEVLQALTRCFEGIDQPFFVVGATSRDLLAIVFDMSDPQRATRDLDICIAIPTWERFDEISEELQRNGFSKDNHAKQRFHYTTRLKIDYEVDVVPFGGISPDEAHIYWPPDMDPMMTVRGFDDVLKQCITVRVIDKSFEFNIPTAGGLFLLKFDAWIDRHDSTDKDALDMMYLMEHYYLPNSTDDKYASVYDLDGSFSEIRAGAYMLAIDICELMDSKHLSFYAEAINVELAKEEQSPLLQQMLRSRSNSPGAFRELKDAWKTMSTVFATAIEE